MDKESHALAERPHKSEPRPPAQPKNKLKLTSADLKRYNRSY